MKDVFLSEKNREILIYLCNGFTSKEIGASMGLSPRTIEDHIKDLKNIFNAKNTPHLIFKYLTK